VLLEGRSAVMVADPQQHLVGILTKIDLIDYFSRRARH
jgi:predicted transcriptional regulator